MRAWRFGLSALPLSGYCTRWVSRDWTGFSWHSSQSIFILAAGHLSSRKWKQKQTCCWYSVVPSRHRQSQWESPGWWELGRCSPHSPSKVIFSNTPSTDIFLGTCHSFCHPATKMTCPFPQLFEPWVFPRQELTVTSPSRDASGWPCSSLISLVSQS